MNGDIKPWGVFATFVLGAIALLIGQFSGIAAVSWWYDLDLRQIAGVTQHGGAIVLFIFVSAPAQVAVLLAARRRTKAMPLATSATSSRAAARS